jgi:hypothetical protein
VVDPVITARLDLIAAKAKILAESYKNNKMWEGDLQQGLNVLQHEIQMIRTESGNSRGWSPGDR